MALLFDGWLADGNAAAKLAAHAYFNRLGVLSVNPVVQIPGTLDLVPNPADSTQTIARTQFRQADPHFADTSVRCMLLPITPTAGDPITDWSGQSAVRRWYRFRFRVDEWAEDHPHAGTRQLCVIWQLHDQADTGDNYWEPPLWLEDDGLGNWVLWNTYDPNAVTTASRVHRELIRFPRVLGQEEEIVIWMKPSWTSGALKIWRNRRLVFTETGVPNCLNHDPARGGSYNFVEYGVYGGKYQQVQDRAVLHWGSQIGDQAYSTFDAFMTACGHPELTELESVMGGRVCGAGA